MRLNLPQKASLVFLVVLIAFWLGLYLTGTTEGTYNYWYSFLFGLIPLIGGAIAISGSGTWGGLKTAMGKAVFFIGLGVFLWGCGELIWSYYNFFLNTAAPYPSLADIGFAPSIFFYGLGAYYLSKITGAKFGLRSKAAKVFLVLAPLVILAVSYYLLVMVARGGVLVPEGEGVLKTILDLAYPLGDFLALTLAIVISGLSFQYMGGRHKYDIVAILLGLGVMFLGDMAFSYATTVGTYYNANWGDLLLTLGTFLLTFGALGFYKLKED
jgi:hypothetical protein